MLKNLWQFFILEIKKNKKITVKASRLIIHKISCYPVASLELFDNFINDGREEGIMRPESGLIGYIIGAAVFFAVSPIFSAMDSVNLKNFFAPYPCPLVFLLANIFVNLMVVYVSGLFLYRLKKSMEGETYRRFFPLTCRWAGLINSVALGAALILLVLSAEAAVKAVTSGKSYFPMKIGYLMQLTVFIAVVSSCLIMHIENKRAEKYIRDYMRRMIRKMGLYN